MTPDEAANHEWLQGSSSTSSTFIITSSASTSSLIKHSREQQKENDQQVLQKYERSQPTILPQIKTPSKVTQRYNNNNHINTKECDRMKGNVNKTTTTTSRWLSLHT